MNDNTIAGVYNNPALVLNTVTETAITNPAGAPLVVSLSPNVRSDGHAFTVNIRGRATGGASNTLQFKLYKGTSATLASDAIVATFTAAAAITAAGGNFDLSLQFIWDSVSQTVNGVVWGQTNGTITGFAAITAVTGVSDPSTLSFVASAKFVAAFSTNTVTVTEFTIDQV